MNLMAADCEMLMWGPVFVMMGVMSSIQVTYHTHA
jgi:hypothetical protein